MKLSITVTDDKKRKCKVKGKPKAGKKTAKSAAKCEPKAEKTADEKKQAKRAYWAKRKAIEKKRTENAPKSEPQE